LSRPTVRAAAPPCTCAPEGTAVDALHGFEPSAPLPVRPPIPLNAPNRIARINDTQRPKLEPPQVTKLGHLVLEAVDFAASVRWYIDTLGFILFDVMPDGTPRRWEPSCGSIAARNLLTITRFSSQRVLSQRPMRRSSLPAEPSRRGRARQLSRARARLTQRNLHALTLIPDHPKGAGQLDAIVNRRNSELILEQPAEMRRTAEAV
jgi:hypothetical protein